ncbi:hypothetical protein FS837_003664 [Tulasnella sp. UAMH 9824]|nr:hypothetical protein FS837_003664 [Tulasnella sp. UAMH 9824]
MRLSMIPSPILSALLLYLKAENLSTLVVDNLEPSQLPSHFSPFAQTVRSLLKGTDSPDSSGEMRLHSGVSRSENSLMLYWRSVTHSLDEKLPAAEGWESWDLNRITARKLSNADTSKLFHVLFDLGVKVEAITLYLDDSPRRYEEVHDRSLGLLCPESPSWPKILNRLESVREITIGVDILDGALKYLSEPVRGTIGEPRYLCPHLTDLKVHRQFRSYWKGDPIMSREHIARRQQAAHSLNGPAKLRKIGVPEEWIDEIKGDSSIFDDIDIFSTPISF